LGLPSCIFGEFWWALRLLQVILLIGTNLPASRPDAPETIRTSDLCLRRAALYPAELWARSEHSINERKAQRRNISTCLSVRLISSLPAHLEFVDRRISTLSERKIDPLHNKIMDFAALLERSLTQRFVDRSGQVQA
jgi:hypothetical protein